MNIDQQLYNAFLNNAGGVQDKIKGISKPTLIKMKRGLCKTTYSEVFNGMFANGANKITIQSEHTIMEFNLSDEDGKKSISVTTKSLA